MKKKSVADSDYLRYLPSLQVYFYSFYYSFWFLESNYPVGEFINGIKLVSDNPFFEHLLLSIFECVQQIERTLCWSELFINLPF